MMLPTRLLCQCLDQETKTKQGEDYNEGDEASIVEICHQVTIAKLRTQ
uniref:Uncharacterized protein n=1 Tax=Arundo donax TaxID=35708 RepID=A0A0A9AUV5_ARUDO